MKEALDKETLDKEALDKETPLQETPPSFYSPRRKGFYNVG